MSLLCTFALFLAPQAEPVAPPPDVRRALELFPADTMLVVEGGLQAWDRLRAQTNAHAIVREQNLLKNALEQPGLPEAAGVPRDSLRSALGSLWFSVGMGSDLLPPDTLLLGIDRVGLGSTEVPVERILRERFGIPSRRFGPIHLALVPLSDEAVLDDAQAQPIFAGLLKAAQNPAARLVAQPGWQKLRGGRVGADDLLRVTLPTADWGEEQVAVLVELLDFDELSTPGSPLVGVLDEVLATLDGAIWTLDIDGRDFRDRITVLGSSELFVVLEPLESFDAAQQWIGGRSARFEQMTVQGIDAVALMKVVRQFTDPVLADAPEGSEEAATARTVLQTFTDMAPHLGSRLAQGEGPLGPDMRPVIGLWLTVDDRAAVVAAWETLPEEIRMVVPFLLSSLGPQGATAFQMTDDEMRFRLLPADAGDMTLAETEGWSEAVKEMRAAVGERRLAQIMYATPASTRGWLAGDLDFVDVLSLLVAGEVSGSEPLPAERLARVRPSWMVWTLAEGGMVGEGRSDFGVMTNLFMSQLVQALGLIGPGFGSVAEEREEDEF